MLSAKIPNAIRKAIYERDGYSCAICSGSYTMQIHHVEPRSLSGSNEPENLITLCGTCHGIAHGIIPHDLPEDITKEDMQQAIIEYLDDIYAFQRAMMLWHERAKRRIQTPDDH